jgi:hypothetical protein
LPVAEDQTRSRLAGTEAGAVDELARSGVLARTAEQRDDRSVGLLRCLFGLARQ